MESSNCVEHNTSTAQQTDGAKDAASGNTAENQEEEVGETSRIVIEISVVFLTFYFIFFCNKKISYHPTSLTHSYSDLIGDMKDQHVILPVSALEIP